MNPNLWSVINSEFALVVIVFEMSLTDAKCVNWQSKSSLYKYAKLLYEGTSFELCLVESFNMILWTENLVLSNINIL